MACTGFFLRDIIKSEQFNLIALVQSNLMSFQFISKIIYRVLAFCFIGTKRRFKSKWSRESTYSFNPIRLNRWKKPTSRYKPLWKLTHFRQNLVTFACCGIQLFDDRLYNPPCDTAPWSFEREQKLCLEQEKRPPPLPSLTTQKRISSSLRHHFHQLVLQMNLNTV